MASVISCIINFQNTNKIMIRPVNDYRIGNLVLDEDGELCKIEQLSSEKMECFQQVSNIENKSCISTKYPTNIYAIELTEEWLKKLGFKLNMDNFNWNAAIGKNEIGDFKLALRHNERIGWFFQSKCTIIRYVHQLQNLFFSLCGEDLVFSTEP